MHNGLLFLIYLPLYSIRFRKERWFEENETDDTTESGVFGDDDAAEGGKFKSVSMGGRWLTNTIEA